MFGLGGGELIIIAVIVLLIFGARRLPEIGKGLGGAIREFKNIKKDLSVEQGKDDSGPEAERKESKDQNSNAHRMEAKVTDKLLNQAPGVKKAVDLKKKADKVKKIIT